MKFLEFLNKETPSYGGFMVCRATYRVPIYDPKENKVVYKEAQDNMLVERKKISNGDMFLINKKMSSDYNFTWEESTPWEILYKQD